MRSEIRDDIRATVIHSPALARELLHRGHKIIDIKLNNINERESHFVFSCTEELLDDLTMITTANLEKM